MTATVAATALPTSDVDPFSHEVLEDPLPMHAELREAGPVVYLTRYDVYAFARYEQVHAALVDWQGFQSAAGRGAVQLPLREAVAPAEPAAGGRPAAARRAPAGAAEGARPAGAAPPARAVGRRRRGARRRGAGRRRPSSTPSRRWPRPSRCGCSPTPSASRRRAGRTCCPTATTPSTPSARATTWSPRARPASPSCPAGSPPSAGGTCSPPTGFGADIWAASRPRRHHPRAGAARRPLAADGRRRHDGARAVRRPLRLRHPPRAVAAAARASRPWRASPSTRRCAGSRRCRPSSGRRPPTSASASTSSRRATRSSCSWARPTATPGAGTTRTRSTCPATRRGTSASGWASTSASASTSPGWRPRRC